MKKIFALILLVTIITGCGGGSSGANSTNTPSNSTGMVVSFSTSTLNFEFIEGNSPTSIEMFGYAAGQTNQPIYVGAIVSESSIQTPLPVEINTKSKQAKITVTPIRTLKPGTYTGTITLLACTTETCTKHHDGSPRTVSYRISVLERFSTAENDFSMLALEKSLSQTKVINLHFPPGYNSATLNVNYLYGNNIDWLKVNLSGSQLYLQADASLLAASQRGETYPAEIKLNLPDNSQTLTLRLLLTVADVSGLPSKKNWLIVDTTNAEQLGDSISFSPNPTLRETKWTASSDKEWLKLDTSSGNFQTQLTWHIDPVLFSQTDSNRIQKAQVSVNMDTAGSKVIEFEVKKAYSAILGLDATALLEQQGGNLMIYGQNFNSKSVDFLTINGVKPNTVTLLSDNVLRANMPPLSSGNYSATFNPLSGIKTPTKAFYVLKKKDYTPQEFTLPSGKKRALIWDAISESIYFADESSDTVYRFSLASGKLQLMASRQFVNLDSIGLRVDRRELIIRSGGYLFSHLNPLDLSIKSTLNLDPTNYMRVLSQLPLPLAILGDNRLITIGIAGNNFFSNKGWLDLDTGEKTPIDFNQLMVEELSNASMVSGDGRILFWAGKETPDGQTRISFDLSKGIFNAERKTNFSNREPIGVTHDGSKWITKQYDQAFLEDSNFNYLGDLQLPSNWSVISASISRQGDLTYVYGYYSATSRQARVYVFDTKSSMNPGISFPIIGFIDIPVTPNCDYTSFNKCFSYSPQKILITDDDRTLIIAEDTKLIVKPIPLEFRSNLQNSKPATTMLRMN